jgi:uroporphyrinogen-III synthase
MTKAADTRYGGAAQQPLAGRHVAITRPQGQADALAQRLEALGARVTALPTIAIAPLEDTAALDAALVELGGYDWLVLTSANGARAVDERLTALGLDWHVRRLARIAVIGPATAAALRLYGVEADVMPDEYVAEGIVEVLGNIAGQRILLLRADIARADLADELRLRGADVDEVAAYRTLPLALDDAAVHALLSVDRPDALTFTSSSTVRGLAQGLWDRGYEPHKALRGIVLAAIGQITAATLREHGLEPSVVATEYTAEGLSHALAAYYELAAAPKEGA